MTDGAAGIHNPTGWRAALPLFLMLPLLLSFPAQLLENSIELTPDHSNALITWSCLVGAIVGVIAFGMMIRVKPELRIGHLVGALVFSLLAGLGAGLCLHPIIDRVWKDADFRGSPSGGTAELFTIRHAYIAHGKGGYDHVQLTFFNVDLHASSRDYHKFFNDVDNVYPSGYCIRATWQRNGKAVRIFIPALGSFPTGSISKC